MGHGGGWRGAICGVTGELILVLLWSKILHYSRNVAEQVMGNTVDTFPIHKGVNEHHIVLKGTRSVLA